MSREAAGSLVVRTEQVPMIIEKPSFFPVELLGARDLAGLNLLNVEVEKSEAMSQLGLEDLIQGHPSCRDLVEESRGICCVYPAIYPAKVAGFLAGSCQTWLDCGTIASLTRLKWRNSEADILPDIVSAAAHRLPDHLN